MNSLRQHIHTTITMITQKGFVLPFTMLIAVLVLFVTLGSMTLLSKQLYFSKLYKDSQTAYYAADDAVSCTIDIDDTYVGADGLGIFPTTQPNVVDHGDGIFSYDYIDNVVTYVQAKREAAGLSSTSSPLGITCGQAIIFDTSLDSASQFLVSTTTYVYKFIDPTSGLPASENGVSSSFTMKMDLGPDPNDIIMPIEHLYRCAKVTVNKTPSFRQIIAQGYSLCDGRSNGIERAVVNTTVTQ